MTHKFKGTLTLSPAGTPTVNNTLFVDNSDDKLKYQDNSGNISALGSDLIALNGLIGVDWDYTRTLRNGINMPDETDTRYSWSATPSLSTYVHAEPREDTTRFRYANAALYYYPGPTTTINTALIDAGGFLQRHGYLYTRVDSGAGASSDAIHTKTMALGDGDLVYFYIDIEATGAGTFASYATYFQLGDVVGDTWTTVGTFNGSEGAYVILKALIRMTVSTTGSSLCHYSLDNGETWISLGSAVTSAQTITDIKLVFSSLQSAPNSGATHVRRARVYAIGKNLCDGIAFDTGTTNTKTALSDVTLYDSNDNITYTTLGAKSKVTTKRYIKAYTGSGTLATSRGVFFAEM
jgi:hypothetical protein